MKKVAWLEKRWGQKNSANTTQVSFRSTFNLLRLLWSMDVEIWDFLQSNHLPKTFRKGCWFRNSGLSSLSSMLVMVLVLPKQKKNPKHFYGKYFSSLISSGRNRKEEIFDTAWQIFGPLELDTFSGWKRLLSTCLWIQIWTNNKQKILKIVGNWLILVIS